MKSDARQRMIAAASRRLQDGEVVLVGVGDPNLAAWQARATHAPNLQLVYEAGAVGSIPDIAPLSIGDPTLIADALGVMSVSEVFDFLISGGRIDTAFVGAAQIDRAGCLNTTVIGDYARPSVRLPGTGGACEILADARRVLVMSPLERRRFPHRVAFVSSRASRENELVVVTDRAVLTRGVGEEELCITTLMPGETIEGVQAEVGWPLQVSPALNVEGGMEGTPVAAQGLSDSPSIGSEER